MEDRSEYLLEVLNAMLQALPPITYNEFNRVFPANEFKDALRKVELKYPELGLARYETDEEGVTFVSILATITDILCRKRLAVIIPDEVEDIENALNQQITAFTYLEYGDKGGKKTK
jgi:hypothetical protein